MNPSQTGRWKVNKPIKPLQQKAVGAGCHRATGSASAVQASTRRGQVLFDNLF